MRSATAGGAGWRWKRRDSRVHLTLQHTPAIVRPDDALGVGEVASSNLVVPTIYFCSVFLSNLQANPFLTFEPLPLQDQPGMFREPTDSYGSRK